MKKISIPMAFFLSVVFCTTSLYADVDYFEEKNDSPYVYREKNPRSTTDTVVLWSLVGATVVSAGVGLYFHLESRDIADDLSAAGEHSRRVYTQTLEDRRLDGENARTYAIIGYSAAGVLAVASIVFAYLSDPGTRRVNIENNDTIKPVVPVRIVPTSSSLMISGGFSF